MRPRRANLKWHTGRTQFTCLLHLAITPGNVSLIHPPPYEPRRFNMSVASAKMPAALVSGIVCLMLGVAGGVVLGAFVDTGLNKHAAANPDDNPNPELKDVAAAKGAPMPGGGGKGGGGGGGKGGGAKGKGGFAPNPKAQLAQLVLKLDTPT